MVPGAHPPSSPTPNAGTSLPLVQTDSSPSGRRELRRASSADSRGGLSGYVTASGLSTWKRGNKSSSKRGKSFHSSSKKGPGMGMEGTPARKRKAKKQKSKSIGMQSTPRATTKSALIRDASHSVSSSSSIPLSSIPDPDESTLPSIQVPPDIPSPQLSPIPVRPRPIQAGIEDVFGLMTFIAPDQSQVLSPSVSILTASTQDLITIGNVEDLSVPVNFPSSEIFSPGPRSHSESARYDEMKEARQVFENAQTTFYDFTIPLNIHSSDHSSIDPDSNFPPNDLEDQDMDQMRTPKRTRRFSNPSSRLHDASDTITHEDLSIPVDDTADTSTSRRLATTILTTSAAATSRFTSSRIGSTVKGRVSTPYRRDTKSVPSQPAKNVTEWLSGPCSHIVSEQSEEVKPASQKISHIDSVSDWNALSEPKDGKEEGRLDERYRSGFADDAPDQEIPNEIDFSSQSAPSDFELEIAGELDKGTIKEYRSRLSSNSPIYYFPLVRGRGPPVPFVPSSQLGTPLVSPRASELTFSTDDDERSSSTPGSTQLKNHGVNVSSPAPTCRPTRSGKHAKTGSAIKATWLGAKVLARMLGEEEDDLW